MLVKVIVYLGLLLLVSTFKTLPFAYLLRLYYNIGRAVTFTVFSFRRNGRNNTFGIRNPDDLFKWISLESYASPLELDMYFHKSYSSYFPDLDISRTTTIFRVFQQLFIDYYDNVHGEFKRKGVANYPYFPIETVQCSFNRDLNPFQRYRISSRIFAWDKKWLFILSKFTTGSDEQLHAYALTKYVLKKNGRLTMIPEEYIKECGLWDATVAAENLENYKLVQDLANNDNWQAIASKDGKILIDSSSSSMANSRLTSKVSLNSRVPSKLNLKLLS